MLMFTKLLKFSKHVFSAIYNFIFVVIYNKKKLKIMQN